MTAARWRWSSIGFTPRGTPTSGAPYGREVEPPAARDPGRVATARLPRQTSPRSRCFRPFSGIERQGSVRISGRRSSGTGRAPGRLYKFIHEPCPRGRLFHSYRNGCPPRRTCALAGCSRAYPCGKTRRPSSTSSISSTAPALITSQESVSSWPSSTCSRAGAPGLRRLRLGRSPISSRRRLMSKTPGPAGTSSPLALD